MALLRRSPRAIALLGLALLACARAPAPPPWIALAELEPVRAASADARRELGAHGLALVRDERGTWLEAELARADWSLERSQAGERWHAPLGLAGIGRPPDLSPPQSLVGEAGAFRHDPPDDLHERWEPAEGGFHAAPEGVTLVLAPGAEPPERARLRVWAERTERTPSGARVHGTRQSGSGFALWPGEPVELELALPPRSCLRFESALEPLLGPAMPDPGAVRLRVRLDGELLLEHVEPGALASARARHALALPAEGRARARLSFELEGGPCYAGVLAPGIGPADPGTYGRRPWKEPRRDLVLFLADTFRADNLAAYGAAPAPCPALDAFASEARVYRNAYSVSTYTLPAHASLLGGLYPRQLGIDGQGRGLPAAARTIAEALAARGWRCVAVTESVFVSQVYGLDQGFESWLEHRGPLEDTLARAKELLAADDGRPLFLFVHTYRTHAPYHVSEESRAALAPAIAIEGRWPAWHARLQQLAAKPGRTPEEARRLAKALERVRAFYLGTAADLDRGFARFLAELDARGLADAGLVFTSDHGEAFLEHDAVYHPGKVWEELVRVPLLVRAPGVRPGLEARPASLVDLPATLARLAGIEPDQSWIGVPLVPEPPAQRPLFLFECQPRPDATLGVLRAGKKAIGFEDRERLRAGDVLAGFDLDLDPRERDDAQRAGAPWPRALLRELGPAAALLLEPVVTPTDAAVDPAKLRELRAMGYAGD